MKKLLSLLLCCLLLLPLSRPVLAEEAESEAPVVIFTAEELLRFSENCSFDTYSIGKSFELGADIDLSGIEFTPIPWFGGSFDGKQHRITGFTFSRDGSRQGLFRIVAESGVVQNLSVSGSVTPLGTATYIGGIAGVNRGLLSNCSFDGQVSGIENVGGIAGHNATTGMISGCVFNGTVTAEHQSAGIAGLNDGTLSLCTNQGSVNTTAITPRQQQVDSFLSMGFDISQLSEDEFLNLSNIGGIAGDNTGIVDRCWNTGPVGYYSTGYNVGGVTGKSSGYISGCENDAEINGRRDVGGIAGQLIPFSNWDLSSGKLDALSWQISILNGQLNNLAYNFDQYGDSIYSSVDRLQSYTADMTWALQNIAVSMLDNEESIVVGIQDNIWVNPETGEVNFILPDLGNVDTSALSYALSNLYGEAVVFTGLARDAAGVLASDIQRVADQITNVFNVLFSTVSDFTDVTPETTDLSETEAYSINTGAVSSSTNRGKIIGEYNCGGILGSSGFEVEFDMEDRLNISDYLTSNSRHSLFAAVRDCSCFGEIEAKSGTGGGIAGSMDIGVVTGCVSAGSVRSDSGDYIGGLVGSSAGAVLNSWSRCLLHGEKYVGGAVGSGTKISGCRTWVQFDRQNEYAGAVAGWAEGPVIGNLFVRTTPAGVDGISISGETDAVPEEDFLQLEGIPDGFGIIRVQYVVEGQTVGEETVPFGGTLRNIPSVGNLDGQYWSWDLPEQERIFTPLTIQGAYHAPKTTLAGPGDPPEFLAEGQFYESQELQLFPLPLPNFTETPLAAYTVRVSGYEDDLTLRMLTETDGALYLVRDNGESDLTAYTRDGRYIVFQIPNGGSFFYLEGSPDGSIRVDRNDLRTAALILLPFFLLFILAIFLIRKKYKKQA